MAGHKETPRQKMISMMYLVLTAMLALNVSKEVLDGYMVVNDSLVKTNENFSSKRCGTYAQLERDFKLNQEEIGPFWDKAKITMKLSSDMEQYIKDLRDELIAETEKISLDSARNLSFEQIRKKDDYTTPTRFMFGNMEDISKSRARKLKEKIIQFRENLKKLVNPRFKDQVKIGLETDGEFKNATGKKLSWEIHHFYDIPLGADVPILNKMIAEVNNAELEVVNGLINEINADDFKYDKIEAKILPNSTDLFPGETYKAEVIVAAYDTSRLPVPNVYYMAGVDSLPISKRNQAQIVPRLGGKMHFELPANVIGTQKYAGFVSMYNFSGKEHIYHFKGEYQVALPSVAVSLTNLNLLYVGVDNPITISVTGVTAKDIKPSISAGTLKLAPDGKNWIANVPSGHKEATISVALNTEAGLKQLGSEVFRIKNLPDPTPYIAGKKDGYLTRTKLTDDGQIIAKMPLNFEYKYNYEVISFKLNMTKGFTDYVLVSNSNMLTEEMKSEIKKTNRGQIIEFNDIVVRAPEGKTRTLDPITIIISY